MREPSFSLIIRGGRVLDPSTERDEVADVGILGSTIVAIGPDLQSPGARVLDAAGLCVVPGLIDGHVHVYDGIGEIGIDPDEIGVGSGVATVIDTGSTGWATFDGFRRYVVARAQTRVLACLHMSSVGLTMGGFGGELGDRALIVPERVRQTIEANRDVIIGIKLRASRAALRDLGTEPIRLARQTAREAGVPLLVHIGETDPVPGLGGGPPPTPEIVDILEPGDILTHIFTAKTGGVFDTDGRVYPAVRAAYERGVYFDVAHGLNNFSFDNVRRLADQGIEPYTISTDVHRLNRHGPVYDLPTTMAKFLALGYSLPQVVAKTTVNVAHAYRRDHELGVLAVGRAADLSLLRLRDEPWDAVDSTGQTLRAPQGVEPVATVRAGHVLPPRPATRPYGRQVAVEAAR